MSLEKKSIHELRGIAQAVGLDMDWEWDRLKLIKKIDGKVAPPPPPVPSMSDEPQDQRLRTVPPAYNLSQHAITEAMRPYMDKGIVLTYPTAETWQMNIGKRQDSGSIRVPLRVIIECAKALYE